MCKIYIILSLNKPNPKAESIERVIPGFLRGYVTLELELGARLGVLRSYEGLE